MANATENPKDWSPVQKRMVFCFVIDKSGSMSGAKIGTVNSAVRDTIELLKQKNQSIEPLDADLHIAVLSFSEGAQWMCKEPIPLDQFVWKDIHVVGGTDMGAAFQALDQKLHDFVSNDAPGGNAFPVLFLMSDGQPTDDYKPPLAKLKKSKIFQQAVKMSMAIGSDADEKVMKEFSEAIVYAHSVQALVEAIKVLTVRASQICSTVTNNGAEAQQQVNEEIANLIEDSPELNLDKPDELDVW